MSAGSTPAATTLLNLLQRRAATHQGKVAFSFSYNGDDDNRIQLTYRELDERARAIAAALQRHGAAGERVLVLCRPGLDHIAAYFGCVYAGAVAIPVHERLAPRLSAVVPDADARFALGISETHEEITAALEALGEGRDLQWLMSDQIVDGAEDWVEPDLDPESIAMVQYTSGSTTTPKGVLLSHRNLLHNLGAIRQTWQADDTAICVFWLPSHHDMGLIGANLSMLDIGCTTHLMSPTAFIKRPMRWLEALSAHRATYTVAPNFAFDACVQSSTPEERAALDLSSLTTVMNGAEPVRATTLRQFTAAFADSGFRPEAFLPVYGLAEATLLVSGGSDEPLPLVACVDRGALGDDRVVDVDAGHPRAVEIVGCGSVRGGQRVAIVDPVTRQPCEPNQVGEIWMSGPSVAGGFWGRPEQTKQTFCAFVADTSDGPYLRTGDLGFLSAGQLFVTGRCKDLIVISGANYYPNDIEFVVQDTHPALVSGRGAVFGITPGRGAVERLVVVQEVHHHGLTDDDLNTLAHAIRGTIVKHHAVSAHSVLLVEHLSIPTTSSGKIQRSETRRRFLEGELAPVAQWRVRTAASDVVKAKELDTATAAADVLRSTLAGQPS